MIYRGLNWLRIVDSLDAANSLRLLRLLSPQAILYNVDAIDPTTNKNHRIRSAVRLPEWAECVDLAVRHQLVSFDGIPFEIHAIEDEATYEIAKGAFRTASL